VYIDVNQTSPNWITLIWTVWRQTKSCITICEICTLLRYYIAQISNFTPMFWDDLLIPTSRVKKSKKENTT